MRDFRTFVSEEKLVGHSAGGFMLYLNPSKEEVERITYEFPGDNKGFRALYFHPNQRQGERVYAFSNGTIHSIVEDYIGKNYIEDAEDLRNSTTFEYYKFLGKIPMWAEGNEEGVIIMEPTRGPRIDVKRLLRMLHLDPDLPVEIA